MNVDRMWMLRNKKMILAYPRNVVSHGKVNHLQSTAAVKLLVGTFM